MGDLGGEELEEPVQLLGVAPPFRDEGRGIVLGRLERANLELQPVAEALDTAEHANGVPFAEPLVEELDVVPDPSLDLARRVDELEREVRAAGARAETLLAGDCVEALDNSILGQLRDRHPAILGPRTDGKLARGAPAEAVSRPALRRGDGRVAGRSGRSSLRRHHAGDAGAPRGPEPVERRAARPPRRRRRGGARVGGLARARRAGTGGEARRLAAGRGVHGAGRGRPHAAGNRRPRPPRPVRRRRRASPRGDVRGAEADAPRAAARHADEALAGLPPPPRRRPRARGRAGPDRGAGRRREPPLAYRRSGGDRLGLRRRRGAAPHRRRPSPLRDRAPLPRGAGDRGDGPRPRRARGQGRRGPRDLPDAPGHRRAGPGSGRRAQADTVCRPRRSGFRARGDPARPGRLRAPAARRHLARRGAARPRARHGSGRRAAAPGGRLHAQRGRGGARRDERRGHCGVPRACADGGAGRGLRQGRNAHAAQEHLLLPQAHERAAVLPFDE